MAKTTIPLTLYPYQRLGTVPVARRKGDFFEQLLQLDHSLRTDVVNELQFSALAVVKQSSEVVLLSAMEGDRLRVGLLPGRQGRRFRNGPGSTLADPAQFGAQCRGGATDATSSASVDEGVIDRFALVSFAFCSMPAEMSVDT